MNGLEQSIASQLLSRPEEIPARDPYIKVCLLGASFSTGNMGVGALSAGAIKCVKKAFPRADIFLLDYGEEEVFYNFRALGRDFIIELLNMRFSWKFFLRNNVALLLFIAAISRLIPFEPVRARLISRNRHLSRIAEADIVATIAGGDSFSDIYGLERFFYVTLPHLLVIAAGKRPVVLPQTIGPFKSPLARSVARFVLGRSSVVYSRDRQGVEEARSLIGPGGPPVRFGYDMGFAVDASKPEGLDGERLPKKRPGGPVIAGLNVSALLFMGGYTGRNMFGLKGSYRDLVLGLIDMFINKKGAELVLIPHVFSNDESDHALCLELFSELKKSSRGRLFALRGRYDQSGIKHVIGQCDFFAGSRMHACIAAISQCVPTAAIAYSGKFLGVMDSVGLSDIVADPRALDNDGVIEAVSSIFDARAALKDRLEKKMPGVHESVLGLFSDLPGLSQA